MSHTPGGTVKTIAPQALGEGFRVIGETSAAAGLATPRELEAARGRPSGRWRAAGRADPAVARICLASFSRPRWLAGACGYCAREFRRRRARGQGIDDALIQPYSGHATRQSLEIYSRLALAAAQQRYNDAIGDFPV